MDASRRSHKQFSVVISTRDRGGEVVSAAQSVLADQGCDLELIIIDQSSTLTTADAVHRSGLLRDPRVLYRKVASVGVCRGRNEGTRLASGDVIAYTDDDCLVSENWASRILHRFRTMPDLAIWFGSIVAPSDHIDGWIFQFHPSQEGLVRPPFDFTRSPGSEANYAVRGSVFPRIGYLDECLTSSEGSDFGYRAWLAHLPIYVGSEPAVVHCGARHGQDVQRAIGGYLRGFGLMAMKHVRAGDVYALGSLFWEAGRHGREGVRQALHRQRPVSFRALITLLGGAVSSFQYDVDTGNRLYQRRSHGRVALSAARGRTAFRSARRTSRWGV